MNLLIDFFTKHENLLYLILGSFFTLLGTFIAWVLNRSTIKWQLKHDAIEREKERDHQILKEVYMNAFDAISKTCFWISIMSPDDIKIGISEESEIDAGDIDFSMNKIELVGSTNTVKKWISFLECSQETKAALDQKLIPFYKLKFQLLTLKDKIEGSSKFQKEIHEKRMELYESPENYDENIVKLYTDKFDKISSEIERYSLSQSELTKEMAIKTLEFNSYKKEKLVDLHLASNDLGIEMRKDLQKLFDEGEYRNIYKEHNERMLKIFSKNAEQEKKIIKQLSLWIIV